MNKKWYYTIQMEEFGHFYSATGEEFLEAHRGSSDVTSHVGPFDNFTACKNDALDHFRSAARRAQYEINIIQKIKKGDV